MCLVHHEQVREKWATVSRRALTLAMLLCSETHTNVMPSSPRNSPARLVGAARRTRQQRRQRSRGCIVNHDRMAASGNEEGATTFEVVLRCSKPKAIESTTLKNQITQFAAGPGSALCRELDRTFQTVGDMRTRYIGVCAMCQISSHLLVRALSVTVYHSCLETEERGARWGCRRPACKWNSCGIDR